MCINWKRSLFSNTKAHGNKRKGAENDFQRSSRPAVFKQKLLSSQQAAFEWQGGAACHKRWRGMTDKESEPCVFLCELHRSPASVVLSLSLFRDYSAPERGACAHTRWLTAQRWAKLTEVRKIAKFPTAGSQSAHKLLSRSREDAVLVIIRN